jgi:hypothetical protein
MEIKGCATCYEGQNTAEVHLITSFINSSKRNEIGVGHKINIRGWRFIFFQFSSVAGISLAKSRDLENQELFCMFDQERFTSPNSCS